MDYVMITGIAVVAFTCVILPAIMTVAERTLISLSSAVAVRIFTREAVLVGLMAVMIIIAVLAMWDSSSGRSR